MGSSDNSLKLMPQVRALPITLPSIDGTTFDLLPDMKGRPYLLAFMRFAACPFCNLRVHELATRFEELGDDFGVVVIFDSPLAHLQQHAEGHHAPFPILADEKGRYYRAYSIEHSVAGMLKGMLMRMPTMLKGMFSGYTPTSFKGSLTTMPADFLVDEYGLVQFAHYGRDQGDHLSFSQVKAFAQSRNRRLLERAVSG